MPALANAALRSRPWPGMPLAPLCLLLLLLPAAATAQTGLLYGTVVTRDDQRYTGPIRWDDEEVYWWDHFNGSKVENPHMEQLTEDQREQVEHKQPGNQFDLFGLHVEMGNIFSDELEPAMLTLAFGAIDRLEVDWPRVSLHLVGGETMVLEGGSNDVQAEVQVVASDGRRHDIDLDDVRTVVFLDAPAGTEPAFGEPLFGRATTRDGRRFEGQLQWDRDERTGSEMLDGDVDGSDQEIPLAQVRSIAPRDHGADVELRDGRRMFMTGTNDVNTDNRGLYVTAADGLRVEIPWSRLERAEFGEGGFPSREAFAAMGPLRGRVETASGKTVEGRLVLDLNESHQAEYIETLADDLRHRIPLALVHSVQSGEGRRSTIELTDGRRLEAHGGRQVSSQGAGVLVYPTGGGPPEWLAWADIRRLVLAPGKDGIGR